MGENGKQAQARIVMEFKKYLQACKELPMIRGLINVKQLAKCAGIQRKNFYDNNEIIHLVNRKADSQGVPHLLFPHERNGNTRTKSGEWQIITTYPEVKTLNLQISRLEKRIIALDSQMKDLTSENNHLKTEVKHLERQQFLDDMALEGRPVRDTFRYSL